MAALTADRDTQERGDTEVSLPVAAGVKLYAGSIGCHDAAGNAVPGSAALGLIRVGRVEEQVDNTTGAAGDKMVRIRRGIFRFANSAGADEITAADRGASAYIVDDQTVAKTDGGGTRSFAGKIRDVDARGVWVQFA